MTTDKGAQWNLPTFIYINILNANDWFPAPVQEEVSVLQM
jgi:hypothetical protein